MNILAKIFVRQRKLIIELPLTNPTGKIRVKQRSKTSNYGLPIATRRDILTDEDYVEWQISYATQNPPEESKVDDIIINDNQIAEIPQHKFPIGLYSTSKVILSKS